MYKFAGHALDVRRGRLLKEARDVHIRPKALLLLAFLVENAGRVIAKDELVEAIWPDVAVTDDSLTQCISDIRRALGPDGRGLIRNIPRRGYLVDADQVCRSEGKVNFSEDQSRGGELPAASAFNPVVVRIVLAPDDPPSRSPVVRQITELVSSHFAELGWLQVAETPYASDRVAADRYQADYSLVFSSHGSKASRIGARLLQSHSRKLIVAHSSVVDDIDDFVSVTHVATEFSGLAEDKIILDCCEALTEKEPASWSGRDNFVYGRMLDIKHRLPEAERYFARAVELGPNLAFAHSSRAIALIGTFVQAGSRDFLTMADESARTALRLDSNNAWANYAAGSAKLLLGDHRSARTYFERAINLAPGDLKISVEYAEFLHYMGQNDEALRCIVTTIANSQRPPVWFWATRGMIYLQAGLVSEAADDFQKVSGHSWRNCLLNAAAQRLLGNQNVADDWLASAYKAQPALKPDLVRATFPYVQEGAFEKLLAAFG